MVRYLISAAIFLGGIVGITVGNGGYARTFFDLNSLIIVAVIPFLFMGALYGYKKMIRAFSVPFKKENAQDNLTKSFAFFQEYGKNTWIAGIFGVIIAVILSLQTIEDVPQIGPFIGMALTSLAYSGFINALIIIPFSLLIKKQIK